jgi:hypothetical protein
MGCILYGALWEVILQSMCLFYLFYMFLFGFGFEADWVSVDQRVEALSIYIQNFGGTVELCLIGIGG